MRPYYQIAGLSSLYDIHLLIADTGFEPVGSYNGLDEYCSGIDRIRRVPYSGLGFSLWHRWRGLADRLGHLLTGKALSFAADMASEDCLNKNETIARLAGMSFDRVHVFRIYLSPIAEALRSLGLESFYSLDVDDLESEARLRISGLHELNGEHATAVRVRREAMAYLGIEGRSVPFYDEIFTCSKRDRDALADRFPGKSIAVLPNVTPAVRRGKAAGAGRVFTMLFVGTLNYYPNTDALTRFADRIAPVLRDRSPVEWRMRVVGRLPRPGWEKRFSRCPEMEFSGWVEDLSGEYDAADVVVAPIRGGGGTRIKIIEAFAHGVPVVATTFAADGLEVEDGINILLGDSPPDFADACLRLMKDRSLGEKLSCEAFGLAASRYSPGIIKAIWTGTGPDLRP
jgi:glycosyltransferase involved in cell wall biosynthesis